MIFGVGSLIGAEATHRLARRCHRRRRSGWQCLHPVARRDEEQEDGIVLDDGTWVDVGPDGRWRPSAGERARAAVILVVALSALLLLALVLSVGGDDQEPEVAAETSTTAELAAETTTTAAQVDPASVGGEPPSAQCTADDRDGAADNLLYIIAADREWNDGAARQQLLKLFEVVGLMDPWVSAQRRRLSAVLFG